MTEPDTGFGASRIGRIGLGTSALGGNPRIYGYDVPESTAVATVERVLESRSIRLLDTSNEYGGGESERRIGLAIRQRGGLPAGHVLATKADPEIGSRDFSGERVRDSFNESAQRLGVARFDIFHLHDPDRFPFAEMAAPGAAVAAMVDLKLTGRAGLIGVAGGSIDEMRRYVDLDVFDVVLTHNRYTLLDQSANALIEHAHAAGVGVINAAPYASGMLAKPVAAAPRYQYRRPDDRIVARTDVLRELCRRFDVPLAALALQFSTRDERIVSTLVGVSDPARVEDLERNAAMTLPAELWHEVANLIGFALHPDTDDA